MSTARLDSLIAEGTGHVHQPIRLADGHTISAVIDAGADLASAVYLWPGLGSPDTDGWADEDPAEVFVTGGDMNGREFCDVPVQALRNLIEQHGGDVLAAADDEVVTAPLAQLRAAGLRCLPWRDSGHCYVRVPFADGTQVVFSGTAADRDGERGSEVSTHHLVGEHDSWQASWEEGGNTVADLYDSYERHLPYEEDTAALVTAILTRARQSGGSAPEEGMGETAEQLAIKALAERGLSTHRDGDAGNLWLVVGQQTTGGIPGLQSKPYITLGLYNDDDDEWPMDRPPVRPADEWHVRTVDSTGRETTLTTQPAAQLAHCVEAIANWLTKTRD
ncbi:hypothetical protein [Streptomyces mirabilis]|uniref:hypothetical protein n=1 Tax=Streptomyces mirabilis TaxID=68239 RepID=UPI003410F8F0